MDIDKYYEYKDELETQESALNNLIDNLKEEIKYYNEINESEELIHKKECELDIAETDLEEVEWELRRLCGSYGEYMADLKESYLEEQMDDLR